MPLSELMMYLESMGDRLVTAPVEHRGAEVRTVRGTIYVCSNEGTQFEPKYRWNRKF